MNKAALKKYAPQARLDFIAAVTRRGELLGLNPKKPAKVERQGDALLINGKPFPARFAQMRSSLESRIREQSFSQVMESMAYTWFNRFVAIRYMELHDYLDHGYRVLSHPDNRESGHTQPQILENIAELDLPGLNKAAALELKLAGNKDEDLFREVLLAQCHALHTAMPFLFESLDDATELLLPDGLLRTDSILATLVTKLDESDWQEVEIIGWLYQFYISEKKDQVIGKVVKSEDIPAATQLFTPNWIVKYLVQNSLGRLWLMANPSSTLASKWEYYIKPAEQTPEVNAQLDALIQARIAEDGSTLSPESLTLLDPACGSGHILVEAYDLLRDIYLERGYRRQDIPRLILEKNLFGLDIDDRAAQLAGFALLMRARADDRRLFAQSVTLNVLALQESKSLSAEQLHSALNSLQINFTTVNGLLETFEQAKTFGSLIQISDELVNALPNLRNQLETVRANGDLLGRDAAENLLRMVAQAEVLAKQFDAVVANPPYMGGKGMNSELKAWAKQTFPGGKADLFAMFIERGFGWCKTSGFNSMVTMQSWMFLSSFEDMRLKLLEERSISTMAHLGPRAFSEISGEVVQTTAFVLQSKHIVGIRPVFFRLVDGNEPSKAKALRSNQGRFDATAQGDFKKIPGSPVAYWISDSVRRAFELSPASEYIQTKQGLATGDNDRFLRFWWEVDHTQLFLLATSRKVARDSGAKWFPYSKGGESRKWYGSNEYCVYFPDDGDEIRNFKDENGNERSRFRAADWYFEPAITWSLTSSSTDGFAARSRPPGYIFDINGMSAFGSERMQILCLLNSKAATLFLSLINPTMAYQAGDIRRVPVSEQILADLFAERASACVQLAKFHWDANEFSWDFTRLPMLALKGRSLGESFEKWLMKAKDDALTMAKLETENNRCINEIYGLESEINPLVSGDETCVTLPTSSLCATALVSYSVGCMVGRYSLDEPSLVYANVGGEGFDDGRYEAFPADSDGIIPITDEAWFDDDGANRIREFVRVVWGDDTESENMVWLAESLGGKTSESADDTIRRYLSRDFYKDHLQTYKRRPIYWLFSSGKNRAFEALVYLHRYNAGTLSRMRMEYVVPLQARMRARIDSLMADIASSSSSAEQKRLQKQKDKLAKQLVELRDFDENLRHYADQRIELDLDDGVKVNYGKFGNLLAEVKTVTGG